jgi:nickel-dependent lactate racemase
MDQLKKQKDLKLDEESISKTYLSTHQGFMKNKNIALINRRVYVPENFEISSS